MAFKGFLKQSTATTIKVGPFKDSTDGDTDKTGLTIAQADVRLSKAGGNMAQKSESTTLTHDEIGVYDCLLDTTDTGTAGRLQVDAHPTGALAISDTYSVLPANVYDSFFSTDLLQVDLTQIGGAAVSTSTAQLGVNVVSSGAAAGVTGYKKNTAVTAFMFYMELTAGGPAEGVSISVQISKDGGAFTGVSDGSGTATEVSDGWYQVDLTGTEMNADEVALIATGTACNQRNIKIRTQV